MNGGLVYTQNIDVAQEVTPFSAVQEEGNFNFD